MPLNTFPERPLTGGMNRDAAGQTLPAGSAHTLENVLSTPRGLFRPPEFVDFLTGLSFDGEPLGIAPSKVSDELAIDCLLTDREVVVLTESGNAQLVNWPFDEGFAKTSGTIVVGSGVDFLASRIKPEDLFAVGTATPSVRITAVTTSTLTLASDLGANAFGAYNIRRILYSENPDLADWDIVYEDLVITTRQREMVLVNLPLSKMEPYVTTVSSTGRFDAGCVGFFKGRLFAGDITDETDGRVPNRLRWSSVTNQRDWSFTTNFLDFDNSTSQIKRIIPLGPVLIVYFRDAIFLGQPTSNPGLPVVFQQVETGGIGLVGQRAVAEVPNGHFFVGQDNIYFLDTRGIRPVGDNVRAVSVRESLEKWRTYAVHDSTRSRVLFGIPGSSGNYFQNVWIYDYTTESWSYEVLTSRANFIALYSPLVATIWLNASGTWQDQAGTWGELAALETASQLKSLVVDAGASILRQVRDTEDATWARTSTIVTRDFDFNAPDTLKSFVRFAMKVEWLEAPTTAVTWAVEGSVNKGVSYKALGDLVIRTGNDEGYVNFSLIGSTVRFRLTSATNVKPYYITEFTMKMRQSGVESSLEGGS